MFTCPACGDTFDAPLMRWYDYEENRMIELNGSKLGISGPAVRITCSHCGEEELATFIPDVALKFQLVHMQTNPPAQGGASAELNSDKWIKDEIDYMYVLVTCPKCQWKFTQLKSDTALCPNCNAEEAEGARIEQKLKDWQSKHPDFSNIPNPKTFSGIDDLVADRHTKIEENENVCPNCHYHVIWLPGKDGISKHCPNCFYIQGEEIIIPIKKTFAGGAVRDNEDTPPYTLIPPCALRRLAKVYREGAVHYGKLNYHKGIPVSNILDHALEHLMKWLDGSRTEDHLAKVAWAMFTLIYFEESDKLEDDTIWFRSEVK